MYYAEYTLQPYLRKGIMVPVTALPSLYQREDAGYSSYYWFNEEDAKQITAQGNAKNLNRFSVYTKYLVIDIDREDNPQQATDDMHRYASDIAEMGLKHSIWVSGGKGYHIYIHCEPMEGIDVPYSQLQWIKARGWKVDESLYQHARLLSNPGRKSVKTGVRKHKIGDYDGNLLHVPRVSLPVATVFNVPVTRGDLARVSLYRIQKTFENQPNSRHTALWSVAGACAEAGMPLNLCTELLEWMNKACWETPKDFPGLKRAVEQAYNQTQTSPSQSSTKVAGPAPTLEDSFEGPSVDCSLGGPDAPPRLTGTALKFQELLLKVKPQSAPVSGINVSNAEFLAKPS